MADIPSKSIIDTRVKLFDAFANSIAWQVGVVSPGFLGLLWNVDKLVKATHLPRIGFWIVFMSAEMFFVAAIVGAVILHNAVVSKSTSYMQSDIVLEGLDRLNKAAR